MYSLKQSTHSCEKIIAIGFVPKPTSFVVTSTAILALGILNRSSFLNQSSALSQVLILIGCLLCSRHSGSSSKFFGYRMFRGGWLILPALSYKHRAVSACSCSRSNGYLLYLILNHFSSQSSALYSTAFVAKKTIVFIGSAMSLLISDILSLSNSSNKYL
jgi:hypothetical protein